MSSIVSLIDQYITQDAWTYSGLTNKVC